MRALTCGLRNSAGIPRVCGAPEAPQHWKRRERPPLHILNGASTKTKTVVSFPPLCPGNPTMTPHPTTPCTATPAPPSRLDSPTSPPTPLATVNTLLWNTHQRTLGNTPNRPPPPRLSEAKAAARKGIATNVRGPLAPRPGPARTRIGRLGAQGGRGGARNWPRKGPGVSPIRPQNS